ncbi:MAG: phosphotransferase family protein [Hyphomicrobiales bacterium]|nr:phosphotransferase family protein [Hyphomicrobiales bacterium]
MNESTNRIRSLSIWKGDVELEPLSGGITNVNYLVSDGAERYVVRLGDDIGEHQIMRFNELAASKAAHAAGISPRVIHDEAGILVLQYISSMALNAEQVRSEKYLQRIVCLVKKCHLEIPQYLRGPALIFWVFHVLRDYGWTLRSGESPYVAKLPELITAADSLEKASGPYDIVFGHNDLLAANILDDGKRLWLVDWDYAGFNSPLFDLGGLASNNEFDEGQEKWLLETYFEMPISDDLWHRYQAMKCASLLRETMWSMVSEIHSKIDFDYASYTGENLARFEQTYNDFTNS